MQGASLLRRMASRLTGIPTQDWEAHYEAGRAGWLAGLDERLRYTVIAAFIAKHAPQGNILDLGCGSGVLREALRQHAVGSYTGVDFSSSAVAEARRNADAGTTLINADLQSWEPPGRYRAIVFNEVLYYLASPVQVVKRYVPYLSPDGVFVVSMYQPRSLRRLSLRVRLRTIERSLVREFTSVDQVMLENEQARLSWRISVLRPRA